MVEFLGNSRSPVDGLRANGLQSTVHGYLSILRGGRGGVELSG
jgi:hypothetical protein